MGREAADNRDLRTAFGAEVSRATMATARTGGLIVIVGMPAWVGFDYLVDPADAGLFAVVRLGLEVLLIGLWLSLFTEHGRRRPELVMLLMLSLVEISIAFMIARIEGQYAPYTLGMSLAIFGSAFLLIWPWRYTAALIGITWLAVLVAILAAPEPLDRAAIGTIAFYLGTASLVGFFGQYHRERSAWDQFRGRVELEREHERNEELRRSLERLSREDPLTGLANRRCWDATIEREVERARRQDGELAVMLIDLDHLKEVNDRFGHATGDRVLRSVGEVLVGRVRATDLAARLGGDEFAVLCPDTGAERAGLLAEELRFRLGELRALEDALPEVTVSIGVAPLEDDDVGPSDLMQRVDDRLYRAKRSRNTVCRDERVNVG
jgi:diguanylate cyclase (GGDEF)-like protein